MTEREETGIDVKNLVKDIIKQLHEGKDPEEVKRQFRSTLQKVSSTQIAQAEQELVKEGMPQKEIRKLCDVHLAVFRESLDKQQAQLESQNHPINVFMEEHKVILKYIEELRGIIKKVGEATSFDDVADEMHKLEHVSKHLMEVEKHNAREENVLFPYLEKHGISEPPAVMWAEHNELKEKKKQLLKLSESHDRIAFKDFAEHLVDIGGYITEALPSHIYKENHILYPAALQAIGDDEWREIRNQCDELGYCCFTPKYMKTEESKETQTSKETIGFDTGSLIMEEVEGMLNALPVDVTFVDTEDTVRYFNKAEGRVFPRTKAVIGRKVQMCHPPKSIHVVNKVIDDLKNGRRSSADFWIDTNQRKIHIRYFPVRNQHGKFLGVMEVTQDITDIKKIEGERRLLNETGST
jgi:PAS domain S-box-containing protein